MYILFFFHFSFAWIHLTVFDRIVNIQSLEIEEAFPFMYIEKNFKSLIVNKTLTKNKM